MFRLDAPVKNFDNYYPIAFLVINILLSLYFLCRILEALLVGFITTSIAFFGPIYLASCKTLPAVSLFKAPSWQDTRGDNQTQYYMIMSLKQKDKKKPKVRTNGCFVY